MYNVFIEFKLIIHDLNYIYITSVIIEFKDTK